MKNTFKIKSIILLVLSMTIMTGCNDLINIESPGITQNAIPRSQDDAIGLVTGC